jgi:hypothetical protein
MNPREQRMAELRAIVEEAKAEMQAIKADEQIEKSDDAQAEANAIPEGMHEMPDGSLMANADMKQKGDAMNFAKAANDRALKGNRNEQGDFVQAGLEVPVEISAEDLDAQSFDKDKNTDAQSAKMKRSSNDPVEMIGDLEMDGGRAAAKEVESSERTMGMTQDEGGTSSVDTKDDFWKTQEGYDKAMEMYGEKPAWVKEPTMQWNPVEQTYEKLAEKDKEEYEDLGISADIKQLFG